MAWRMRVVATLLMLSRASALTFAGRPGARAAHPRMQFGDFLKGFDEAKKSLEKDLGVLTGGQELQDDGYGCAGKHEPLLQWVLMASLGSRVPALFFVPALAFAFTIARDCQVLLVLS